MTLLRTDQYWVDPIQFARAERQDIADFEAGHLVLFWRIDVLRLPLIPIINRRGQRRYICPDEFSFYPEARRC